MRPLCSCFRHCQLAQWHAPRQTMRMEAELEAVSCSRYSVFDGLLAPHRHSRMYMSLRDCSNSRNA
jgi:hypothetical protein